jgi:arsenate reductase
MARVLFVCKQNAGRSQMSDALFKRIASGRHESGSAGTRPAASVHPVVIDVMRELGIDLSSNQPRRLSDELALSADVVVTMGCGDECPYVPGKRYVDWDLPDPAGASLGTVRMIRDEIRRRVEDLARQLDAPNPSPAG